MYRALKEHLLETELSSPWLWPISRSRLHPHNPATFTHHHWPLLLKRAGVKHRNLYQCRHTFATLLLQGGAEWRYVADQMGHADAPEALLEVAAWLDREAVHRPDS
jgi:integrase